MKSVLNFGLFTLGRVKGWYTMGMITLLKHTLLGVPIYTWVLQLLYVAIALLILFVFVSVHKRTTLEIAGFVVVMILVDIAWRIAIK